MSDKSSKVSTPLVNDGGPAYPNVSVKEGLHPGMTLRDYFAGQALANPVICGEASDWEIESETAYAAADAMVKRRTQ